MNTVGRILEQKGDRAMRAIKISRKVDKWEYRKFLYLILFHRKVGVLVYIFLLSLLGGFFISRTASGLDPVRMIVTTLILHLVVVVALVLRYEKRNIKFSGLNKVDFYSIIHNLTFEEDKAVVSLKDRKEHGSFAYRDLVLVMEAKTMLIVFFDKNFGTYISKKETPKEEYKELQGFLKEKMGDRYKKTRSIF